MTKKTRIIWISILAILVLLSSLLFMLVSAHNNEQERLKKEAEVAALNAQYARINSAERIVLGDGTYYTGVDFKEGTYDLRVEPRDDDAQSKSVYARRVDVRYFVPSANPSSEELVIDTLARIERTEDNKDRSWRIVLTKGTAIMLTSTHNRKTVLEPVKSEYVRTLSDAQLDQGMYIVGQDIGPGTYEVSIAHDEKKILSQSAQVKTFDSFEIDPITLLQKGFASDYIQEKTRPTTTLTLKKGQYLSIDNLLQFSLEK